MADEGSRIVPLSSEAVRRARRSQKASQLRHIPMVPSEETDLKRRFECNL